MTGGDTGALAPLKALGVVWVHARSVEETEIPVEARGIRCAVLELNDVVAVDLGALRLAFGGLDDPVALTIESFKLWVVVVVADRACDYTIALWIFRVGHATREKDTELASENCRMGVLAGQLNLVTKADSAPVLWLHGIITRFDEHPVGTVSVHVGIWHVRPDSVDTQPGNTHVFEHAVGVEAHAVALGYIRVGVHVPDFEGATIANFHFT